MPAPWALLVRARALHSARTLIVRYGAGEVVVCTNEGLSAVLSGVGSVRLLCDPVEVIRSVSGIRTIEPG